MFNNLKSVANTATRNAGLQLLRLKANSPTLMFGVGVVGVVATAVLASKATLKLPDILDDHERRVQEARETQSHIVGYTKPQLRSDLALFRTRTTIDICKAYAPAVVVGAISIGSLTGAHVTLTRRNTGLMAAYAAIDTAFKEYRERVRADVGEDKDKEYRFGSEEHETIEFKKSGEPVVTRDKRVGSGYSDYARLFGPGNKNWNVDSGHNLYFLKSVQSYLTDELRAKGVLLLNDVYTALGMEKTAAGAVVGWVVNGPDGYVDFGCWDAKSKDRFNDFMQGREDSIVLDFNVQGVVYDQIGKVFKG